MENTAFRKLLALIEEKGNFNETLASLEQHFMIKLYKITGLGSAAIGELYQNMQKKFYANRKKDHEEFWFENELRIFIWLLFGYLYVHQKPMSDLNDSDWNFFSQIFNCKSTVFFQFQALSITKPKQRPVPWSEEETATLQGIMQQARLKNRWNSIARELFVKSGKRFFRNPKQCRERWMNHLDPSKVHSEWTADEDLVLLTTIRKRGKRWSLAVRELNHTRTEHMVKNRYKSLISNESKKNPEKCESEIEGLLIRRLTKVQERSLKNDSLKAQEKESEVNQNRSNKVFTRKSPTKVEKEEKREGEVKIEDLEQEESVHVENFHFLDELSLKSPIYIPWKNEIRHSHPINLMDDERMDLENHSYDYSESQNSGILKF